MHQHSYTHHIQQGYSHFCLPDLPSAIICKGTKSVMRCSCNSLLKRQIVPTVLIATGRKFQTEGPEKARLVLQRSMRGLGSMYHTVLLLYSLKRDVMYDGTMHPFAININSALLKSSCPCNGRMLRAFSFSPVDKFYLE